MKLFLKYFWPKEMRLLIDEYREQGILNNEAVRTYNKQGKIVLSTIIFLIILFWYIKVPLWGVGLAIVCFIPCSKHLGDWALFYCNSHAYSYGERKKAIANSYRYVSGLSGRKEIVKYTLLDSKERGECSYYIEIENKHVMRCNAGDTIEVFHNLKDPKYSMPNKYELKKKYSLRTDIL